MYKLLILEEADKELQDAAVWYEEKSNGLGLRFVETISKKIESIHEHPTRYAKRKGNFREAIVRIFPFSIIYVFSKVDNMIIIHAIYHTSRNSKKKYRKRN